MNSMTSAFPITARTTDEGMTLRDYFAAKAMQGLIPQALKQDWSLVETAVRSYAVADAMITAREA
jgi:hypothetical protein